MANGRQHPAAKRKRKNAPSTLGMPTLTHPITSAPATGAAAASRHDSVDLLRGLVMVVMALDHVRDYFHFGALHGADPTDLAHSTPAIFLTRFITHYCAPIFSFLAGT